MEDFEKKDINTIKARIGLAMILTLLAWNLPVSGQSTPYSSTSA